MAPSTKLAVLLSVWMCLTLSQTGAIKLICPAGWINLEDGSCFKPFTKPLEYRTYERASQVCRTYGSHLAVYNDQYENNALGQVVTEAKSDARKANFWIGFRRVYNEACKCLKFYSESGMERNEADPTNLFWSDRNPDETKGKCVYLEKNDEKYVYDVEYTAAYGSCNTKRSFVCQRPAAPEGSFFCAAGGYVKEPEDVCDGVFDCTDGSDEANCPSLCRFKYEMDSGEISLTGYSNSRTCVWAIVTPLGTNAYLEFTSFSTENMADVVHILVGGTSEWSADVNLVAALSGNPNIGDLKYTSYNNMLVVKFDSDNFQTANGFDAKFGSVRDVIADNVMALTATSTKKTVSPPETGNSFMFLGSVDYVWTIRADNAWDIITVQILDFNESTPVTFYDGDSPEAPVLSQLCKACDNYNVVFSTGSSMSISLQSDFGDRSFSFTFRTGCHATFLSSSGELFSPGYPGNIDYANGQICTWIIDAPEPISLYFEGDLDIQDVSDGRVKNSDCLELYTTRTNTTGVKQHPDDCFTTATLSNTRLFQSANGKAFLKFVTSPIRAAKGFLAYFSPDCVDPLYDNKTTGYVGKYYTAKQDMVCAMGYEFSHEAVNVQTVTLECMFGGKWNYKVLPRCAPWSDFTTNVASNETSSQISTNRKRVKDFDERAIEVTGNKHQKLSDPSSKMFKLPVYPQAYDRQFLSFPQPVEIGAFSQDIQQKFYNDRSQLQYYIKPPNTCPVNFDLRVGYKDMIRKDESCKAFINDILHWIIANPKKCLVKNSDSGEGKDGPTTSRKLNTDFVCFRGLLTRFLCAPYENNDGLLVAITLYNGTYYMYEYHTDEKKKHFENQTERQDEMCCWGWKFEQYLKADSKDGKPDPVKKYNNIEAFATVVQSRLNSHSIVFAGEVDALSCDERGKEHYVEFKVTRKIDNPRQDRNFQRYKLIKWWAQSVLVGIPEIVCGFRDDVGIVHRLESFQTLKIPESVKDQKGYWKPNVCFNFLDRLLSFIKEKVTVDDHRIVYLLEWKPKEDLTLRQLQRGSEFVFLPDWYTDVSSSEAATCIA